MIQAPLPTKEKKRDNKMATAFSPYRPPEHGLVSFVLSNLLPTKKEDSKEESARLSHLQVEMQVVEMEGTRRVQEEVRGVGGSRGQLGRNG